MKEVLCNGFVAEGEKGGEGGEVEHVKEAGFIGGGEGGEESAYKLFKGVMTGGGEAGATKVVVEMKEEVGKARSVLVRNVGVFKVSGERDSEQVNVFGEKVWLFCFEFI